jgi:iron only hydrogenase large subunit-like protein
MPCISRKEDIIRKKYLGEVDAFLTVNEFAYMVKHI